MQSRKCENWDLCFSRRKMFRIQTWTSEERDIFFPYVACEDNPKPSDH